jgi:replicative DNA helicase
MKSESVENQIKASSQENEMMVLGTMINNSEEAKKNIKRLREEDFTDKKHKQIFNAIKQLIAEDHPTDILLIQKKLTGNIENREATNYLLDLSQFAGTSAHLEAYCDSLQKDTAKRRLINLNASLVDSLKRDEEPYKIVDKIKSKIEAFEADEKHATSNFKDLIKNNSESLLIEEIRKTSPGVKTGFTIGDVDLKLPGGALSVIALPTGHGKTTFLINATLGVLKNQPDTCAYFFSYEECTSSIVKYFLNTFIGEDLSKNNRDSIQSYFRDGKLDFIVEKKRDTFKTGKDSFFNSLIDSGKLRIFYTDMTVEELIGAIRFLKKETNVGLICIDYIQCLKLMKPIQGSRQEQLKEISLLLKDVAVETGIPILLGAQFNRQVVCEADISPTNIREAADIEQIASLLIGGWNRNYAGFSREGNKDKTGKPVSIESTLYLEIMKGRGIGNGHKSVMNFNGNTGKITNRSQVKGMF